MLPSVCKHYKVESVSLIYVSFQTTVTFFPGKRNANIWHDREFTVTKCCRNGRSRRRRHQHRLRRVRRHDQQRQTDQQQQRVRQRQQHGTTTTISSLNHENRIVLMRSLFLKIFKKKIIHSVNHSIRLSDNNNINTFKKFHVLKFSLTGQFFL